MSTEEDHEIVAVDQWIKFNCRRSVAALVQVFQVIISLFDN